MDYPPLAPPRRCGKGDTGDRLFPVLRVWVSSFLAIVLLALLVSSCSSERELIAMPVEERFERAMTLFNNGDYRDAIEEFRIITLQHQATAFADDAQFYMAESMFRREEYILAAYEYEVLLRTMPTSEFVPQARFQRAMCFYHRSPKSSLDQGDTRKAIDEFQAFLEYHPTHPLATQAAAYIAELNEKLAKKDFDNAVLYMRLQSYKAAIYYCDLVLEKFHDTQYAERAQLIKAEAFYRRKRYAEAKVEIETFFQKYPQSSVRNDALRLQQEILNRMAEGREEAGRQPSSPPNTARPVFRP